MKAKRIQYLLLICFIICSCLIVKTETRGEKTSLQILNTFAETNHELAPPNPNAYKDLYKENNKNRKERRKLEIDIETSDIKMAPTMRMAPPNQGKTEKLLIIPIQFTNVQFDEAHNTEYFEQVAEKLREYYEQESSYIPNTAGMSIETTVVEPVTSVRTMEYYGADVSGIDNANGDINEMAREAVLLLDSRGFDFSQFDIDLDDDIDHLLIIHAGLGQEYFPNDIEKSVLIWSHHHYFINNSKQQQYFTVPEDVVLGVLTHEFGHDIGLPDLYDVDYDANGETNGVGYWDVMGSGAWNFLPGESDGSCPSGLSAWSKLKLGWVTKEDITANISSKTIEENKVYAVYPNGDNTSNEYFLVEYRRKDGYDMALPGQGILIWHVDKEWITAHPKSINAYEDRLGLELEEADGNYDLWNRYNQGDNGDPFPGSSENRDFVAVPYGLNYSNINLDDCTYVEIKNITLNGDTATGDFYIIPTYPTDAPTLNGPVDNGLVDIQPEFGWNMVNSAEGYILQIAEDNIFTPPIKEILVSSDDVVYVENRYTYKLSLAQKLDSGKTYYWRIAGANNMSNTGNLVWSDTRSFETKNLNTGMKVLNIQSNSTANSITLNWNAVAGATGYYVLVDGVEVYTDTNSYTHTPLDNYTRHRYKIRAVNDTNTGEWSNQITSYTLTQPSISIDMSGVVEGSENGSNILINLTNDTFRADGIFNRGTVFTNEIYLPKGISIGNISRIDDDTLSVGLVGNSTVDYDSNIVFSIEIDKEETTLVRYSNLVANGYFIATVEAIPDAPNILFSFDGANAGKLINSTTAMEYSLDGGSSYTQIATDNMLLTTEQLNSITPNNDIKIRVKESLRADTGLVQIIDIIKPEAPDTVIANDTTNTVSGIDTSMEFSTDGTTWTKYNDNLPLLNGNLTLYVRSSRTGMNVESEITTLTFTVPPPEGITFSFDGANAGKLINSTTAMEYSLDGGTTYIGVTENDVLLTPEEINSITAANDIKIRYKASGEVGASQPLEIDIIKPAAPAVSADDENNIVADIEISMEFSTDGTTWTKYNDNLPLLNGNLTLYVRSSRTGMNVESEIATLEFTVPPPEGITFSFDGANEGKLINSTTAMEYSLDGGTTYIGVTENDVLLTPEEINSITAANDILIRNKADGEIGASQPLEIDIIKPAAPAVSADDENNIVADIETSMEFSTDGTTWTKYNDNLPSLNGNLTLYVRSSRTGMNVESEIATLEFTVPPPEGITFSFDGENAGKLLNSTTTMEYSLDGGTTYIGVTENNIALTSEQMSNITSQNDIKIRNKATEEIGASLPLVIDIFAGPAVPNVSYSDNSNRVIGIDNTMEFSADEGAWTKYNNNLPDLSGNITIKVRYSATGVVMAGDSKSFVFKKSTYTGGGGGNWPSVPTPSNDETEKEDKQEPKEENETSSEKTLEQQVLEQLNNQESESIIVEIPDNKKDGYIILDSNTVNQLLESEKHLIIKNKGVEVFLPTNAINIKNIDYSSQNFKFKFSINLLNGSDFRIGRNNIYRNKSNLMTIVGENVYQFEAEIISEEKTIYINQFNDVVTVTISLENLDLENIDVDKLGVYYYNQNTDKLEYIGGKYSKETNSIVFKTNHFSLYTLMTYEKTFDDIKDHWARVDIEKMAAKFIAQGRDDKTFDPDSSISRSEFTALVVRALELKEKGKEQLPFEDIANDKWYHQELTQAYNSGIVLKTDGVSFRPEVDITREEMVVIITRALAKKIEISNYSEQEISKKLENFEDKYFIVDSAREAFAQCIDRGIVQGRSSTILAPKGNATRAEAIVIIKRVLDLI